MARQRFGSTTVVCAALGLLMVPIACSGSSTAAAGAAISADRVLVATPAAAIDVNVKQPEALAFDRAGNLYVSEFAGHYVDRIGTDGSFTRVAGQGQPGYSGDGGPAVAAYLNMPTGLLVQPDGQLVIADHRNHCIRTVDAAGVISRIAGTCTKHGEQGDGGPALDARLDDPIGLTRLSDGSLIIADEQNAVVREVTPDGVIHLFAGGGKVPVQTAPNGTLATDLKLSHPSYVVADGGDNVYMSDFWANVVIEIAPDGRITRIAGTGVAGFSGDCGPATKAKLDFPTGLALHGGQLYISDAFNNRVRMVDRHGIISTVAGSGPTGVENGSYSGDGEPATQATLNAPAGLAFDRKGDLYISDQGNDAVRMVTPAGDISLVAGKPLTSADAAGQGITGPGEPGNEHHKRSAAPPLGC